MKAFKSYFIAGKANKPRDTTTVVETAPPSTTEKKHVSSRPNSMFAAGSFRNEDDIKSMKTEVMAEWVYKQLRLKLWATAGPEEGVIMKKSRGEYACCPMDLRYMRGGLFEQIVEMNVACAMTVNTNVISIFVSNQLGDTASLQGGLSVQILPSISDLSSCLKHQFAAFIRDRGMLVVWDDDPEKIIEHTLRLETLLMMTIWNDGADYADDEKELTVERIDEITSLEQLEDGLKYEEPRRLMYISPFIVAGTLILTLATLGLGWRKLVVEVAVDGSYIRLGLLLTSPIVFFVGLFSMQSIMGCLFQILGPVKQVMVNSRAYSGKAPRRLVNGPFPHITVQMPVYKESLNAVIKPTIISVKAAISTYELQGGTANIFVNDDGMQAISEEDALKRQDFYEEHSIGWVSRPKHNLRPKKHDGDFDESKIFNRKGKFKKASNMNYGLMVSNCVEEKLANIRRHEGWTKHNENKVYEQCFSEVLEELNGKAWAAGNIRVGDYILIIDCDTRVPRDCLLDAASEMENSPEVAIIQFSSGVMNMTHSYFENGITFFTNLIYTAIRFAVASGDVCPFVGHNAILRWSALQQVTYTDEDGYEKFWSESHVSEDFDMALRLQCEGYRIRLGAYQGDGFKEGVSLTVYDELARWEKYAYGCNELLFHPIRLWLRRSPFTPLFRKFITSNMPIHAKLTIMAYICTYYALGAGWILTVSNYFIMGWYAGYVDAFYLDSFAIYCSMIVIFTGLSNVSLAVLRYRTSEKDLLSALLENFSWVPLLMIFLGGISLHISQALLSHMFEINMSWGSTAKEVEDTTFFKEMPILLRKFRVTFLFCILMIGLMIAGVYFFPAAWRINTLAAIYPLAVLVTCHMLLPIALNPALMKFTY